VRIGGRTDHLALALSDGLLLVSHMDQYQTHLDDVFTALADPTRRAVLARLGRGAASVGELAAPFDMALPSFMKHIALLERSGLVASEKHGRVRTVTLDRQRFAAAETWLAGQRAEWEAQTDRLERFVTEPLAEDH
jgi:DNA-binding transcriptional ArsR family regulator